MSADNKAKCCKCDGKLSQYELSDNVYAGLTEKEYVCYACQFLTDVDEILENEITFDDDEE